ncbi:long-chain fatty acid--CoA ligase [Maridesulfovibrio ferrireducens]|uniref:long-chain-fatty-acid--CoA ligase n=1 Tax=Maridesulfovibrio ferrireducens TaxID=246191 RepID=UPI001A2087BC|nr:long-chain fatty acid--CoA ligase [Maridesulfovibrio ferrireducens]MBI9109791.1 long-chain fatty acid--CoA ligase [Maridesulfovibrio ferrireducens]
MKLNRPWLDHYDPEVPKSLDFNNCPLFDYLDRTAEKWPKRKAIEFQNWSITYEKLKNAAEVMAANLRKNGIKTGDRVALMLPNTPQMIISYWAVLKAGAVVTLTNPLYMETEIIHQINDSGAQIIITLDMLWPKLQKLRDKLPVRKYYITRISDALKFPLKQLYNLKSLKNHNTPKVPYNGSSILKWKTLLEGKETYSAPNIRPLEDTALLQYTGGTTGLSKGCNVTHANLGANIQQFHAMLHKLGQQQEVVLGILPYFHIYGLTVCLNFSTSLGATMVPFPRYVPLDVLKAMHKLKPTLFPGAPSLYISLLQQKELAKFDIASIKYCLSGSSPMPVEAIQQFNSVFGSTIVEGYGLTEASPVTHLNPLDGTKKAGSIGVPLPGTDAAIVDMEVGSLHLPPGKMGELIVRGPQVMKGYYNKPDETAGALRNGWLYTGDIAYMDEEGYFYIVDRKKDMIISSGYNIYPREVDEILYEHPKIQEAVTVGLPHKTRGEVIKVYIVLKEGQSMDRTEVIGYCREKLAGYKVPRKVEFRKELPKTMVGKVLRRALREEEAQKKK